MSEWTPEAIAAEETRRAQSEAAGICPDSGLRILACQASVCDCFRERDETAIDRVRASLGDLTPDTPIYRLLDEAAAREGQ